MIGIGNPFRCDDGIGPAVATELERASLDGVRVLTSTGDPAELLTAWTGVDVAIIVDAGVGAHLIPGRIRRWRPGAGPAPAAVSSHTLDLPATCALGEALGRMPRRLVVLTVDAAEVGFGATLSPAVAAVVPAVVAAVCTEIGRHRTTATPLSGERWK
ncbi:Hydrogenase 2 maturation endopeptidase [Mycobacterium sp. smrl_JER01]